MGLVQKTERKMEISRMDGVERAKAFREEMEKRDITILRFSSEEPSYHFDLNKGQLTTRQNLDHVWELVKLAREYAFSEIDGEHNAILNGLHANKSDIDCGAEQIWWKRLNPSVRDRTNMISFKEYLEQQGYNMREIYGVN